MGALAQIADDYETRLPWNLTPAQSWFTKGPRSRLAEAYAIPLLAREDKGYADMAAQQALRECKAGQGHAWIAVRPSSKPPRHCLVH